jgi:hypothetical protein
MFLPRHTGPVRKVRERHPQGDEQGAIKEERGRIVLGLRNGNRTCEPKAEALAAIVRHQGLRQVGRQVGTGGWGDCRPTYPENSELRGNGFWTPETEGPELPLKRSFFRAETAGRPCAPQNRGVFVKPPGISVSAGVRGGPGRTRTYNQTVMSGMASSSTRCQDSSPQWCAETARAPLLLAKRALRTAARE